MAEMLDSRPQASSSSPLTGGSFFSSLRNPLAVLLGEKVTAAAEDAAAQKVRDVIASTSDKRPVTRVTTTGNAAARPFTEGGGPPVIQEIISGGPSSAAQVSTATPAPAPAAPGLFGTAIKPIHLAIAAAAIGGIWLLSKSRG